jgi:hypothetical protein
MCQYVGFAVDATKGLAARMEQPSSPRRSGEFSMHFTGGRSAAAAREHNVQKARIVRLMFRSVRQLAAFSGRPRRVSAQQIGLFP